MINRVFGSAIQKFPSNSRLERIWKLAQTEFKKRYYNDRLGLLWALMNPLFQVAVYYWVFTYIFNRVSEGIPNFAIFLFGGIIAWQAFVETTKKCMKVLSTKRYLFESIQVNKLDLFLSTTIASAMGFAFNLGVFIFVCFIYGLDIKLSVFWLPLIVLDIFLIGCGLGMFLSIIYIYLKDINHVLDIALLFGFWSSGVFFRAQLFYELFPPFVYINPFIGIIMNIRSVVMNGYLEDPMLLLINTVYAIILFIVGFILMKKLSFAAIEKM